MNLDTGSGERVDGPRCTASYATEVRRKPLDDKEQPSQRAGRLNRRRRCRGR